VLQLSVSAKVEPGEFFLGRVRSRPVANGFGNVVLELVCEQVERLGLWHAANLIEEVFPVLLLLLWFFEEGDLWGVVESTELLSGGCKQTQ